MAARASRDNIFAGAIFVALGAFFAIEALSYDLGTLFRMGPGFMPLALGWILIALGVGIAVNGFVQRIEAPENDPPSLRAIGLIGAAIIFFGVTIRGLGFIPTVFVTALLTVFASRTTTIVGGLTIAAALTVLATLIFSVGLRLQVPLLGPWLPF